MHVYYMYMYTVMQASLQWSCLGQRNQYQVNIHRHLHNRASECWALNCIDTRYRYTLPLQSTALHWRRDSRHGRTHKQAQRTGDPA